MGPSVSLTGMVLIVGKRCVGSAVYTPWAIKRCHFYFYDNFGKCGPISIILSLLDSQITAEYVK